MGVKGFVKQILTEKENRRYEKLLRGKKISYGEWAAALEKEAAASAGRVYSGERQKSNSGERTGYGAEEAAGSRRGGKEDGVSEGKQKDDFVVIFASQGFPAEELLWEAEEILRENPEVFLLYGDEDVWENGDSSGLPADRQLPWFKPDWSPDLLDSFFYFGSMVIMRKSLFRQAPCSLEFLEKIQGKEGFDSYRVTDFPAYERWMHRCVRLAGGYHRNSRSVRHIPGILFHARNREEQEKFLAPSLYAEELRQECLREFRRENRESGGKALVSVVIPSKDQPEILKKCLEGCILAAGLPEGGTLPFEVIVVDNGSRPENREKTERLLQETEERCARAVYLYRPEEFNFSKMCNLGAEQAEGDILLFLNDDVELCRPGCLERMAALAGREAAGAVGLKLYYPDSVRIQHAGITNLPMGPVHKLQFLEDDRVYYYRANRGLRNVLAVTAACLMVERRKYLEAEGFREELQVAFNDVDFCFRLYELGYYNVCVNEEYAYHHESLSRGADETPEKLERLLREREKLYERHPALEGVDPYYSCFLNREGLDTGIRPAYLTAGNRMQRINGETDIQRGFCVNDYRSDNCLMVRIEDCRRGRILGYGVVLGDNNACYDRMLLFGRMQERSPEEKGNTQATEGSPEGMGEIYALNLTGQYRPDLEANMPDQVRVALCGFDVEIGEGALPEGRYRLGMAARNRVTGLKLVNWSSRFAELSGSDRAHRFHLQ